MSSAISRTSRRPSTIDYLTSYLPPAWTTTSLLSTNAASSTQNCTYRISVGSRDSISQSMEYNRTIQTGDEPESSVGPKNLSDSGWRPKILSDKIEYWCIENRNSKSNLNLNFVCSCKMVVKNLNLAEAEMRRRGRRLQQVSISAISKKVALVSFQFFRFVNK